MSSKLCKIFICSCACTMHIVVVLIYCRKMLFPYIRARLCEIFLPRAMAPEYVICCRIICEMFPAHVLLVCSFIFRIGICCLSSTSRTGRWSTTWLASRITTEATSSITTASTPLTSSNLATRFFQSLSCR